MRIRRIFSFLIWALRGLHAHSAPAINFQNTLQELERMGIPGITRASQFTVEKGTRKGESPIYYIKLPPFPYHSLRDAILPPETTTQSFLQLDLDFVNNGRPEQIYHWNYKPDFDKPNRLKPLKNAYLSDSQTNEVIDQIIRLPPEIPVITGETRPRPKKPVPSSKFPFISLNNPFVYNGKPSGLYIWKPKPTPKPVKKYKHHYFKHFNY